MAKSGDASEATQAVPKAAGIRVLSLHELRDMHGNPMVKERRFLLHADGSNPSRPRMLDWESNKRQIVFNPSRNDGLYLTLDDRFCRNWRGAFGIYYPAGGEWLLGNLSDSNDVCLGKNQLSSVWFFTNESIDTLGHKCYEIWSWRAGVISEGKMPIFLPEHDMGRAGYDKDYEWRTYTGGSGAPYGFFKVKFELVDVVVTPRGEVEAARADEVSREET